MKIKWTYIPLWKPEGFFDTLKKTINMDQKRVAQPGEGRERVFMEFTHFPHLPKKSA